HGSERPVLFLGDPCRGQSDRARGTVPPSFWRARKAPGRGKWLAPETRRTDYSCLVHPSAATDGFRCRGGGIGVERGRAGMALNAREQLANIPVIANETARMVQTFRSWPQSHWSRSTYCPGWTATDAVAHLATGGDFYAQVITSGRSGEPKFAWGANSPAEAREARQAAVQKLLDGGPAAVLAGFEQAGAKLQAVLEALQEAELTKVALHPRGRIPLGSWIGMRILELSAHDWDIRQPHETHAHLSLTAVPALLSAMPELHVQWL